jgi:hydrogenase maturation protein HypF
MGRLFDAVAALCGIRYEVNYEGQAAIELEMTADPDAREPYPFPLERRDSLTLLDARPLIAAIARDAAAGCPVATIAGRFHHTVAATTVAVVRDVAQRHGTKTVVLSGGVFQNVLLLERTSAGLASAGLRVLVPQDLPVNDGGIAFGQIAAALSVDC